MQSEQSEMPPQLAAKLANGPVQAENEALRAYQMRLMLLEQQRQSLQAIKRSAEDRTEQNEHARIIPRSKQFSAFFCGTADSFRSEQWGICIYER